MQRQHTKPELVWRADIPVRNVEPYTYLGEFLDPSAFEGCCGRGRPRDMGRVPLSFLGLLSAVLFCVTTSFAGQNFGANGVRLKGFKIAEPYGPPYEKQIKSLLE